MRPANRGRSRGSYAAMAIAFAVVLALLLWLDKLSVTIEPSFGWYLFCGFCPGPERDSSRHELFHPADAAGAVYSLRVRIGHLYLP